jgi:hypothetical protein
MRRERWFCSNMLELRRLYFHFPRFEAAGGFYNYKMLNILRLTGRSVKTMKSTPTSAPSTPFSRIELQQAQPIAAVRQTTYSKDQR